MWNYIYNFFIDVIWLNFYFRFKAIRSCLLSFCKFCPKIPFDCLLSEFELFWWWLFHNFEAIWWHSCLFIAQYLNPVRLVCQSLKSVLECLRRFIYDVFDLLFIGFCHIHYWRLDVFDRYSWFLVIKLNVGLIELLQLEITAIFHGTLFSFFRFLLLTLTFSDETLFKWQLLKRRLDFLG